MVSNLRVSVSLSMNKRPKITTKMLPLRKAMLPLYIISKILCTGAFSLKKLRPSKIGTAVTLCQMFSYGAFHVWSDRHNMSHSAKNMVRQIIDAHNQYCGLCAFCFLVIASLFKQPHIVQIIQSLEDVDRIFQEKLSVAVDNRKWQRFVHKNSLFSHAHVMFNFYLIDLPPYVDTFSCKFPYVWLQ